ncbi:MAG: hypothetical protein K0R78_3007, partial [Pelosinus sp.]|nr:hypothetical protein [Pelosinus sp.]
WIISAVDAIVFIESHPPGTEYTTWIWFFFVILKVPVGLGVAGLPNDSIPSKREAVF